MSDLQSRLSERLGDRYTIERELGRGGMATVVLARERKHDRAVAIKVLRPELAVVLGTERFLREIDVAAGLQHPHILPLYDSGQADDLVYYVMPYVAGESLRDRLARERQLPVEEALGIARDVAGALAYAHSHGVVHRDIKPENILLTAGHAIVADFGIARALDAAGGERLTATGLALGTPAYMSPEQASASPDLDGRSDVYALGCVLYETLAGQPPFTGVTVESLVAQHLTAAPPSVTTLRPAVPPAIATVIGRALAKTPADRFATAQQFREALSAVPPGPVTTATEPPRKRRPRASTGVALGMGAALLAVAFIVAWWLREPAGDPVTPEASIIVVVPFVPVTADTALGRLGRELAVTLSANLDGVGGIRTVEPLTVLAHVPEGASLSPDAGSALARQLGARAVLQGTLFRTATAIRIDASLATVDGDEVLARTTIAGQADDVLALTDSATFAILKQVWRRGEPAVPNVAAITTHSVEALRAYVEGEAALARADFVTAVDAFERAFAADSSFFFAYWRSLYPRVYEGTTRADRAVVAAVVAHRHEFPPVDRLMIESGMADSLSQRLAILRQATTRFPTYWPAWWSLANNLVHQFPYLGTTMGDARAALERTVELNPGFYPAWGHLFWYRILERDSALAERTFATLDAVGDRGAPRIEAIAEYFEELLHLVRHGGRLPAEQQAAAVAFVRGMPAPVPVEFLGFGFTDFRFPQAQVAVNEAVLALDPPRALAASMWFGIAMSAVARGQWRAVIPAVTQWVAQDEHPAAPVVAYGLVVAGAHLGALDPADAAALRPGPEVELGSDEHRAERVWLDGILAHARADRGGMAEARAALPAAGGEFTDLLDRSLAAFELDLTGDRAQAARRLAALEWESAERVRHHRYARTHPFLVSVHRQFAARGLLAAGDTTQAERLLTWTDGILWGLHGFAAPFHRALAPAVAYERARIAAARGRTTEARTLLRQFIEAYDRPEGEWTARVEEALGLLRRLDDAAR